MNMDDANKKILTRNMAFIKCRFKSYDIEKPRDWAKSIIIL